jgi:hypothetical protein
MEFLSDAVFSIGMRYLALNRSGCFVSFLGNSPLCSCCLWRHCSLRLWRGYSHTGQPLPIFAKPLLVRGAQFRLQGVIQPFVPNSAFPAGPVPAQIGTSARHLAPFVYFDRPLRGPDYADQFALGAHLPTLHAGAQWNVFGCHSPSPPRLRGAVRLARP